MSQKELYTLGIDIGSTTVKIALVDENNDIAFSDYERHFANIQETLSDLLGRAIFKPGAIHASPVITGSGGFYAGQASWRSFRTGSDRSIYGPAALCASDRRGHRAWAARMPRSFILKAEMWNSV